MNRTPLLLAGAGGHARACIDVIEQQGLYSIQAVVGLAHEVGARLLEHRVIASDADLPALRKTCSHALVAVGQIKSPEPRIRLFERLEELGYELPVVVSPRAYVSRHASLGAGTIVMHGAIVNAGAVVGRNCILNTLSLVEHDCVVEDHCHLATQSVLNSGVHLGRGTFAGSHSSVRQGTRVGERCVIGMGQGVLTDCPPGAQLPPRKVRS